MAQEPSKTSIQFIINDIQSENIHISNDNAFRWNFPIKNCNETCTNHSIAVTLPPFAAIKTLPESPSVTSIVNNLSATSCQTAPTTTPPQTFPRSTAFAHNPTTPVASTTPNILSRKTPTITSISRTAKKSPYNTEAYMNWTLENLRAEHYCKALNDAEADSERFYQCVFDPTCARKMKGKGNLRRHIEWHLKKVEQDARCQGNVLLPEEYRRLKTDGFLEQQKRTEQQRIRMEQRNTLQRQLHTQLQHLVQT